MEIYAAMVEDIDINIEKLLKHLRKHDYLENTFIFFMSDNGAAGTSLQDIPLFGDWIVECCNNSYENMGRPDSYVYYGQNWARVSTGPLRNYKGFSSEGGIRVPAFVSYPKLAHKRMVDSSFISVMDVMPTLLELAKTQHPGTQYKGRNIHAMKGESMLPMLRGERDRVHTEDYWMGWEWLGRRAIIQGDWKLLMMEEPWGIGKWQLYNLGTDPFELNDLSDEEPGRLNVHDCIMGTL